MYRISLHFVLVACLFLFSGVVKSQDNVVDQIVGIVGSNIILKSDIETRYMQMQAQGSVSRGDMRCEVMEDFLVEKLLLAEAEMDSTITVSDYQVNQEMKGRMQLFYDHLGSDFEIEKFFKKPIREIKSDLEQVLREQIMIKQMQQKIAGSVQVTPAEVRRYYANGDHSDLIPDVPEKVEYAQIVLKPEITEREERRVKNQLRELKQRIEDGASFSTMAVLYSEGPSARLGGELDYMGKGQLDPAYADVAFSLKKGQVSKVVKSDFGYHIIQMVDKKGEKVKTRHILMKPKIDDSEREAVIAKMDTIMKDVNLDKMTWKEAAMKYSTDDGSRANGGIVVNNIDLSTLFSYDQLAGDVGGVVSTLGEGEVSKPIYGQDEKGNDVYKLVKVIRKIKSHKASVLEDYQTLSEIFKQSKQAEALQNKIEDLQSTTYIRIDPLYLNCNFKFEHWIK